MTEPERRIARQLIDQARRQLVRPECDRCGDEGSYTGYSHGCRQALCRQAHATYKRGLRARNSLATVN